MKRHSSLKEKVIGDNITWHFYWKRRWMNLIYYHTKHHVEIRFHQTVSQSDKKCREKIRSKNQGNVRIISLTSEEGWIDFWLQAATFDDTTLRSYSADARSIHGKAQSIAQANHGAEEGYTAFTLDVWIHPIISIHKHEWSIMSFITSDWLDALVSHFRNGIWSNAQEGACSLRRGDDFICLCDTSRCCKSAPPIPNWFDFLEILRFESSERKYNRRGMSAFPSHSHRKLTDALLYSWSSADVRVRRNLLGGQA